MTLKKHPRVLTLSLFQGKIAKPAEFYCFTSLAIHNYTNVFSSSSSYPNESINILIIIDVFNMI